MEFRLEALQAEANREQFKARTIEDLQEEVRVAARNLAQEREAVRRLQAELGELKQEHKFLLQGTREKEIALEKASLHEAELSSKADKLAMVCVLL